MPGEGGEATQKHDDDDDGACCSKRISRYRCGRNSTMTMMLTQAFVALTSVSLVKAIVLSVLFDPADTSDTQSWVHVPIIRAILPYSSYALYPITGSLLTGVQKRCDLVRRSLGVTWAATIVTSALLVLYEAGYIRDSYTAPVFTVAYLALTLALAVFHSNLIPLGLEQLESASASKQQVVTFLHAYLGLESFAYGVALLYPPLGPCDDAVGNRKPDILYLSFACAASMTVVMALTLLCHDHVTIEEPDASNPLKLIFQVSWYSSRVHSGHYSVQNNISGVPFTTKEVKDVKSFVHFLPLFLPLGLIMVTNTATGTSSPYLLSGNSTTCDTAAWAGSISYITIPTFILLYHLYDLCCGGHQCLKIMHRIVFGTLVMVICVFVDLILALVQWKIAAEWQDGQSTYFYLEVTMSAVSGVSVFLTASAVVEFVCAQSSFPMKTVLVNFKYMADGLGTSVGAVLLATVFSLHNHNHNAFWYLLTSAVPAIIAVGFSLWNAKKYRMRKRDEKRYEDTMAERVSIFSSVTPSSVIIADPSSVV